MTRPNIDDLLAHQDETFTVECPCGCKRILGRPMEFVDGKWVVLPYTREMLENFLKMVEKKHS